VTVPDVVGNTRNEAAAILGNLGLRVTTTYVDSTATENSAPKPTTPPTSSTTTTPTTPPTTGTTTTTTP
jgi:serine/threonine-protein kinase